MKPMVQQQQQEQQQQQQQQEPLVQQQNQKAEIKICFYAVRGVMATPIGVLDLPFWDRKFAIAFIKEHRQTLALRALELLKLHFGPYPNNHLEVKTQKYQKNKTLKKNIDWGILQSFISSSK